MKRIFIIAFAAIFVSSSVGQAEENPSESKKNESDKKALETRIRDLEESFQDLQKQQSEIYSKTVEGSIGIRSFLSKKISLGGFFETAFSGMTGKDTEAQISANTNILGINLAEEYNEKVRLAFQLQSGFVYLMQNQHNNPDYKASNRQIMDLKTGSQLTMAYSEFSFSPVFNLQMGIGYVPFGQAYQKRESVLFKRRGGPLLITLPRPTSVGIAFPMWMGLHLYGSFPSKTGAYGYNLYSFTPTANKKSLGVGSRLWAEPIENMTIGISGQMGKQTDDEYYSYGADLDYKIDNVGITMEYGRSVLWNGNPSPHSYYFEPYYTFHQGQWILYGAADFYDDPINISPVTGGMSSDPYTKWVWGGGINWLPYTVTRFRIGFLSHEYTTHTAVKNGQERSYYSMDFSAGIAF